MFDLGIKSVETVQLFGFVDPTSEAGTGPVRSMLFGELLDRSVTENYKSDFYHDAMWLQRNLVPSREPMDFLFVTRLWGTDVGFPSDESAVYWAWMQNRVSADACRAFYVRVWNDADGRPFNSGMWHATFVEVG